MRISKTTRNFIGGMAVMMLAIGLVSLIGCSDDDNPSSSGSSLLGIVWTQQLSNTTMNLRAIAWGGGKYVAVGEGDTALVSSDGEEWSKYEIGDVDLLVDIIYGGGQFVAVGINGQIFTSTDGMDWIQRVSGTSTALSAIAWTGEFYCVVGSDETVLMSDDGTSWDDPVTDLVVADFVDIIWAEGQFVAFALPMQMMTSPDGLEWSVQFPDIEDIYQALVYGDKYVALGPNGYVAVSDDAETWTPMRQIYNGPTILKCVWTKSMYVAVGFGEASVYTSTDAQVWTGRYSGTIHELLGIAWSPSLKKLVAVGFQGNIILSE